MESPRGRCKGDLLVAPAKSSSGTLPTRGSLQATSCKLQPLRIDSVIISARHAHVVLVQTRAAIQHYVRSIPYPSQVVATWYSCLPAIAARVASTALYRRLVRYLGRFYVVGNVYTHKCQTRPALSPGLPFGNRPSPRTPGTALVI
jgi:hypothetical protein